MDYKELIERMRRVDCVYANGGVLQAAIAKEAATAIETLLAERDAAIEMLRGECRACKHNVGWHNVGKCCTCTHETAGPLIPKEQCDDNWKWRGPQKGDEQ